ncbi:hypothetical protein BgiBS90_000435, partial [Biomphalaria glabrata]
MDSSFSQTILHEFTAWSKVNKQMSITESNWLWRLPYYSCLLNRYMRVPSCR